MVEQINNYTIKKLVVRDRENRLNFQLVMHSEKRERERERKSVRREGSKHDDVLIIASEVWSLPLMNTH